MGKVMSDCPYQRGCLGDWGERDRVDRVRDTAAVLHDRLAVLRDRVNVGCLSYK